MARSQWQHAVEATALKLRLDPLAGALACLPLGESTSVNPWLLNWRTLATDEFCHLQDLLKPLEHAAFPPSLWLEEGEEEEPKARSQSSASAATVSSGTPTRLNRLLIGNLAERAAQVSQVAQDELDEREVIALLGLRLTPSQWNILRLLLAHPLLSDEELADFLGIQRRSVRCSLYELHHLGCLEPIATEVGKRWHFCARGLRLMAASSRLHIGNITTMSDDAAQRETSAPLQRGEAWLVQRIQHTAGIYGFFTRLAQAARREPEQALCWWETGVVRDLTIKFTSYAQYIASREWAREDSMLPVLVCVAPDIAQERRMQRMAQTRLAHAPGLVVLSTTDGPLNEQGPLAPIWLQSSQAVQSGSTLRQEWFNLIPGKKVR